MKMLTKTVHFTCLTAAIVGLTHSPLLMAEPSMQQVGVECYYVHGDHLNSAKVLTDGEGLKQHYEYKAFGGERFVLDTENFVSSRRFTDQVYDEDTGLYYYGARYYDPLIGRFLQADPVIADPKNSQDLNSYTYVRGNPFRYIDPSGNIPEKAIPISETIELSTAQEFFVWLGGVGQGLRNFSNGIDGRISQVSSVSLPGGVDLLDFPAAQSTGFNTAREALKSVTEVPRAFGAVLNDEELSLKDNFIAATTLVGAGVTAKGIARTGRTIIGQGKRVSQSAKTMVWRWWINKNSRDSHVEEITKVRKRVLTSYERRQENIALFKRIEREVDQMTDDEVREEIYKSNDVFDKMSRVLGRVLRQEMRKDPKGFTEKVTRLVREQLGLRKRNN